jgi:hypothetical protein
VSSSKEDGKKPKKAGIPPGVGLRWGSLAYTQNVKMSGKKRLISMNRAKTKLENRINATGAVVRNLVKSAIDASQKLNKSS